MSSSRLCCYVVGFCLSEVGYICIGEARRIKARGTCEMEALNLKLAQGVTERHFRWRQLMMSVLRFRRAVSNQTVFNIGYTNLKVEQDRCYFKGLYLVSIKPLRTEFASGTMHYRYSGNK